MIHKRNGGLSSARNAGMQVATGSYIGFVDSDDAVEPNMYEKMYKAISDNHASFVMSDYMRVPTDGKLYLKTLNIAAGFYDRQKIKKELFPSLIMGDDLNYGPLLSVWHCLYDLAFLRSHSIEFDEEVRWSEDNIFSAMVGYQAESFYYLKEEGLYHYYQNPGTITTSYRKGAWEVYKTMNHHLAVYFADKREFNFQNQLKLHLIFYACNCIGQTAALSIEEGKKEIHRILNDPELEDAFHQVRFGDIPLKLRIQLWLMKQRCSSLLQTMTVRRSGK